MTRRAGARRPRLLAEAPVAGSQRRGKVVIITHATAGTPAYSPCTSLARARAQPPPGLLFGRSAYTVYVTTYVPSFICFVQLQARMRVALANKGCVGHLVEFKKCRRTVVQFAHRRERLYLLGICGRQFSGALTPFLPFGPGFHTCLVFILGLPPRIPSSTWSGVAWAVVCPVTDAGGQPCPVAGRRCSMRARLPLPTRPDSMHTYTFSAHSCFRQRLCQARVSRNARALGSVCTTCDMIVIAPAFGRLFCCGLDPAG